MPPVNCFNDYSPWADGTVTILRSDKVACTFVVILHGKYKQRYNKSDYEICFIILINLFSDNNVLKQIFCVLIKIILIYNDLSLKITYLSSFNNKLLFNV